MNVTLKIVNNSVIGHIDGGIRKRFYHVVFIEGEMTSESKRSRATPLVEPFNRRSEVLVHNIVIAFESRVDMSSNLLFPSLIIVRDVPLILKGNDALISRTRNHFALRLPVLGSFSGGQ